MATDSVPQKLVFGITLDQADKLNALVRIMTANGDVFATGGADHVDDKTVHTLGQAIFDSGHEVLGILSQSGEQLIEGTRKAPNNFQAAATAPARPLFDHSMHTILVQAEAIVQVLNTAAYQADSAEGMGGSCWAVADMLQRVIDYVETNFSTAIDGGAK